MANTARDEAEKARGGCYGPRPALASAPTPVAPRYAWHANGDLCGGEDCPVLDADGDHPAPTPDPLDLCQDKNCPLYAEGVWGHPIVAHASWGVVTPAAPTPVDLPMPGVTWEPSQKLACEVHDAPRTTAGRTYEQLLNSGRINHNGKSPKDYILAIEAEAAADDPHDMATPFGRGYNLGKHQAEAAASAPTPARCDRIVTTPRTAAGRALLANLPDIIDLNDDILSRDGAESWIARIEAEAEATPAEPLLVQDLVRIGSDPAVPMAYRRTAKELVNRLAASAPTPAESLDVERMREAHRIAYRDGTDVVVEYNRLAAARPGAEPEGK